MKELREKLSHVGSSFRALRILRREDLSFGLQIWIACGVIIFSLLLRLSTIEASVVMLAIGAVLAIEALNSAIEELCDHVTPSHHPHIGKIKDLASGASLIICTAAGVVGFLIFIPHILALL